MLCSHLCWADPAAFNPIAPQIARRRTDAAALPITPCFPGVSQGRVALLPPGIKKPQARGRAWGQSPGLGDRDQPAQGGERASAGCKRSVLYELVRDAKFPANSRPQSAAGAWLAVAPGRPLVAGQGAGARSVRRPAHCDPIGQRFGSAGRSTAAAGGRQNRRLEGSDAARGQTLGRRFGGRCPMLRVRLRGPKRGTRFHRFEPELDRFRQGRHPGRGARLIAHTNTWIEHNQTCTGQNERAADAQNARIRH